MLDHKQQSLREQTRAWKTTFRSMLKPVTIKRKGVDGVFDPETETYTGGEPDLEIPINGMFREVDTDLQDGVNIVNTDSKLTVLQHELVKEDPLNPPETIPVRPLENDKVIDHLSQQWRVLSVMNDPTEVYWHLVIRRV